MYDKENITNFILIHIENVETYDDALKNLNKLIEYLSNINYKNEYNDIIFSNKKIYKIICIIIDNDVNIIEKYDNDTVKQLVNLYLGKNYIMNIHNFSKNTFKGDSISYYFDSIKNIPLLSKMEEIDLFNRYQNGDENAKNILINSNLRLVVNIAKNYQNQGMDFLDLIQVGNIGLIKAVENFDLNKNCRLSTFATKYIFGNIKSLLAKSYLVHISDNTYREIQKYFKAKNELKRKLGYEPTRKEIMCYLNLSPEKTNLFENILKGVLSLNYIYNSMIDDDIETGSEFENLLLYDNTTDVFEITKKKLLQEDVKKLVETSNLTKDEKTILIHKYYLCKKYNEIANQMGISLNRVRQLELQALKKIAKNEKINNLVYYADNVDEAIKSINKWQKIKK